MSYLEKEESKKRSFFAIKNSTEPGYFDNSLEDIHEDYEEDNFDLMPQVFRDLLPEALALEGMSLNKACNIYNDRISKCSSLPDDLLEKFEQLYKYAYRLSRYKITPNWINQVDVLFIADAHVLAFVKKNGAIARHLISANTILCNPITKEAIVDLGYRVSWIVHHLGLMYNDGNSRLQGVDKMVKRLKKLGAIDKETHDLLCLCHQGFDYTVRNPDSSGKLIEYDTGFVLSLTDALHIKLIKVLWLNAALHLLKAYVKVQEPYLLKFHNLWSSQNLNLIKDAKQFFVI